MSTKSDNSQSLQYNIRNWIANYSVWKFIESPYIVHLVLGVAVFTISFPILYELITSFRTDAAILRTQSFIPRTLTLDTYYKVLITSEYWKAIRNSAIIATTTTIIVLALATPAGYIFSRYRFRFDNIVFLAVIGARFFPPIGLSMPYFRIMADLGLLNTRIAIIIVNVYLWLPLAVFMMRNFYMSIPQDIDEVARVDGATKFQTFRKVIFPLVLPGFAGSGILTFLFSWREFTFSFILSRDLSAMPISVAAYRFLGDSTINWASIAATAGLAMIPPILVVIFFHRYITSGLTGGSVKG